MKFTLPLLLTVIGISMFVVWTQGWILYFAIDTMSQSNWGGANNSGFLCFIAWVASLVGALFLGAVFGKVDGE